MTRHEMVIAAEEVGNKLMEIRAGAQENGFVYTDGLLGAMTLTIQHVYDGLKSAPQEEL